MTPSPFTLHEPRRLASGVVFASPHSGRHYPEDFRRAARLDALALRSSEDAFVDLLFAEVPSHGAPLLAAQWPRAWLDLNRSPGELDPVLVEGARPIPGNPRLASGLGVIPRVVAGGRAIYRGRLSLDEARARIDGVHVPYHDCLARLMDRAHARFGTALLLDLHSMPHEALDTLGLPSAARPQIILGDRYGASAHPEITGAVEAVFAGAGFRVARNTPFAGAYVAQTYGRPSQGRHVVQVEIDRALYLDERRMCPGPGFGALRDALAALLPALAALAGPALPGALAAE